ncbi:neuroblast differentiation-associated protein AHNAK isoform X7, partial [Silurus asotus]
MPDVDIEGPDGKMKGSKFNMPSFSGPKISMPDVDFNLKGPKLKGDVDVSVPKVEADIKAPKVDIKGPDVNVEGPEGGFKMPKVKMPSFAGPKISMPDVDFNLKGPKLKGDVDISVPKVEADIKAPKVDIKGPDVDVEGPEGGFKMPKVKMPSFAGPKISMPDVDFNLKGPKLKGDVDVSV